MADKDLSYGRGRTTMGETTRTDRRLYRTDSSTGIRELAYPVGASVPVEEYRLLTAGEPSKPKVEPKQDSPVDQDAFSKPRTKKDLVERLTAAGVEFDPAETMADLMPLLEAAESTIGE